MKRWKLLLAAPLMALLTLSNCVENEDDDDLQLLLFSGAFLAGLNTQYTGPVFFYQRSNAAFNEYTVSWISYDTTAFTVNQDQITLDSIGLNFAVYNNTNLLITNCSETGASGGNGALRIYDLSNNNSLTANLSLGVCPQGIAVNGTNAYIALQGNTDGDDSLLVVSLLDLSNPTLTASITVGEEPQDVFVANGLVYVANLDFSDNDNPSISEINPLTNTVTRTISVGENPVEIVSSPSGNLFTYNAGDSFPGPAVPSVSTFTALTTATTSTTFPDSDSDSVTEQPAFPSGPPIAFNNSNGYIMLRDSNDTGAKLFNIDGSTGIIDPTPVDANNAYQAVGTGVGSGFTFRAHRGAAGTDGFLTIDAEQDGQSLGTLFLDLVNVSSGARSFQVY